MISHANVARWAIGPLPSCFWNQEDFELAVGFLLVDSGKNPPAGRISAVGFWKTVLSKSTGRFKIHRQAQNPPLFIPFAILLSKIHLSYIIMLKSNPSYLGIAGKNPALGPPKSALGLRPWADFGGPRAGFFPEFLGQGLDFLPKTSKSDNFQWSAKYCHKQIFL